jgi:hypothetical protein
MVSYGRTDTISPTCIHLVRVVQITHNIRGAQFIQDPQPHVRLSVTHPGYSLSPGLAEFIRPSASPGRRHFASIPGYQHHEIGLSASTS